VHGLQRAQACRSRPQSPLSRILLALHHLKRQLQASKAHTQSRHQGGAGEGSHVSLHKQDAHTLLGEHKHSTTVPRRGPRGAAHCPQPSTCKGHGSRVVSAHVHQALLCARATAASTATATLGHTPQASHSARPAYRQLMISHKWDAVTAAHRPLRRDEDGCGQWWHGYFKQRSNANPRRPPQEDTATCALSKVQERAPQNVFAACTSLPVNSKHRQQCIRYVTRVN